MSYMTMRATAYFVGTLVVLSLLGGCSRWLDDDKGLIVNLSLIHI